MKSLENFKFGDRELKYLKSLGIFKDWFLDYLRSWSWTWSFTLWREGTIFFQNEPILQVEGPLPKGLS
jgi:nicotinate phosphoribosyltransferase